MYSIMVFILIFIGAIILIAIISVACDEKRKKGNKEFDNSMSDFKADKKYHTDSCYIGLLFDNTKHKARYVYYDLKKYEDIDCADHGDVAVMQYTIAFANRTSNSTFFGSAPKDGEDYSGLEVAEVKDFVADKFLSLDKSNIATTSKKDACIAVDSTAKKVMLMKNVNKPSQFQIIDYRDIISVEIIEDGTSVFSKSTTRTVGGALVGNVLMGGAGAVVGGLSGNTKKVDKIKSISIKILLRSVEEPSVELKLYDGEKIKTDSNYYIKLKKFSNDIKDIISVIIDSVDKEEKSSTVQVEQQKTSVTDELIKLAKLKEEGVLTEEEFANMKAKLLNQ